MNEAYSATLHLRFPATPIPKQFFWKKLTPTYDDTLGELSRRIANRKWTDITILDWAMLDCRPFRSSRYLNPSTFVYYLPSLIVGVFQQIDYLDFYVQAIIPDNKDHTPRGQWWEEFTLATSPNQRAAILESFEQIRTLFPGLIGDYGGLRGRHIKSPFSATKLQLIWRPRNSA